MAQIPPAAMLISAIVPAYNAERFLQRAVGSLLATGYPSLEVLIVEDGSTDGTLAVAQALQAAHPRLVRVLRHAGGKNRGVSASRNLGIEQASGSAVCFLDADDYVLPHRFERALQTLLAHPDVDGIYDATCIGLEDGLAESGLGGEGSDGATFALATPHVGEELLRQLLRGYPWHPDAFLCRREMFQRTGVFDEGLRIAEDCNLWFRTAALCRIVPGDLNCPVAVYVRHADNTYRYSLERKVDMLRAMARAWKHVRGRAAPGVARAFGDSLVDYVVNTIVVARESAQPAVAWTALRACLAEGAAQTLLRSRVLKQIAWLARESVRSPPGRTTPAPVSDPIQRPER